jgi:hypothetical protein
MTEAIEAVDLLLRVPTHVAALRQVGHELPHARANLIRAVGRRGADERVDVVACGLVAHGGEAYR